MEDSPTNQKEENLNSTLQTKQLNPLSPKGSNLVIKHRNKLNNNNNNTAAPAQNSYMSLSMKDVSTRLDITNLSAFKRTLK